ncbi:hypothetical protein G6Z92_06600 [Vibrio aestuarianus subsp. cardii]|uniref:hypothetical protein n=1 Tax=Vibrio aestuarianus TaxID=28171 RepID=UPI0015C52E0F|nr:hypothetical protein [Vibrio aestuarianus]NGZ66655.1 hypothetical protein [Vibrio aestuarianus subsp. cardii]
MTVFKQRVEELANSATIACDLLYNMHQQSVSMNITQQDHFDDSAKITFSGLDNESEKNRIVELLIAEIKAEDADRIGIVFSEGTPSTDTISFMLQKELTPQFIADTVHQYLKG